MALLNFKLFMVFVFILNIKSSVKSQIIEVNENEVEALGCYNPNKQIGSCISIYDCAPLRYILQHKFHTLYDFIRASECSNGKGKPPFVCCTKDIKFNNIFPLKKHNERIIFPDEFERSKRTNDNDNVNDENKNSETTLKNTTIPTDTEIIDPVNITKTLNATEFLPFTMTESTLIVVSENLTKTSETDSLDMKFPKPPKCGSITIANKIYGGNDADLGEFSWMVILEYRNATTGKLIMDCSGSIINEFYVLTAAHCVQGDILTVKGKLESVRVGEHNTESERDCYGTSCQSSFERIKIDTIIPHADYKTKTYYGTRNQHDIALLRLMKPIKFHEKLRPACLPNVEPLIDFADKTKFTVAGWGHNGTELRTAVKQKVVLPFVEQIYAKKLYLSDEQLCAGGQFRKDSCTGDSGGPLMRLHKDFWILEGIVSFGVGCGLEKPGIYTNVRHYLDWIDQHVKNV